MDAICPWASGLFICSKVSGALGWFFAGFFSGTVNDLFKEMKHQLAGQSPVP